MDGVTVELQHITIADSTDPNNKNTINSKGELIVSFPGVTNSVYSEVLVAIGVTPTQLFASNTERRKVTFQNYSDAGTNGPIFYGIASGATGYGKGIAVLEGESVDLDNYTGSMRAVLNSDAAAGITVRILEKF